MLRKLVPLGNLLPRSWLGVLARSGTCSFRLGGQLLSGTLEDRDFEFHSSDQGASPHSLPPQA